MELLGGGKKPQRLQFKKICLTLLVISFIGTIIFISRVSDYDLLDTTPESVRLVKNNGVTIYVITPTYARAVQKAELTRYFFLFFFQI